MGGVRGGRRGEFFIIMVIRELHPIREVGDGSIPSDMEVGEYPSGGTEDCFHQERVASYQRSGRWNVSHQDFEVGEYPSGGAEDCFHHEGVGRREYSKGSREEFPIRLGGRMIMGEEGSTHQRVGEGKYSGVEGRKGRREV
jgi:hypothetical protein